ncbi:C45 family peptidase [Virgibacillus sp. SK37]|uniref:C45 family autoproteolytic acyltransferase/hydolase n=1 Tax=Virgibacillus sp. SK37 TaxID=403957 RepID=UPI0004D1E319|nr:C45 family peptidase [Virgibacillus sp. SK37]AIF42960.1 peptidase C45 [Virgibacillus sp. SK37]
MTEFSVKIIQLRDTSFNIGRKLGNNLQGNALVDIFESVTKPAIDYKNMTSIFSALAPHLLDELEGLAEGLGISSEKAAALFSGYDVPKTDAMGCSAIMTKDYYVRNYDFSPALYDGLFSLIQSDAAFATAGYNLQLLGRHDGINQHGLVAGLHFVSNHGYMTGISAWTAIRMILDMCSTVDDAVQLLKEIPHAACYNFSLGDKHGKMAVVEASPENIAVRSDEPTLACLNHFQVGQLEEKNRESIDGSVTRNNYMKQLSTKKMTHENMFDEFRNIRSPLFFTDYENMFGTLHTISYAYYNTQIKTTIAQSDQILEINFQDWVEGKDVTEKKLIGMID